MAIDALEPGALTRRRVAEHRDGGRAVEDCPGRRRRAELDRHELGALAMWSRRRRGRGQSRIFGSGGEALERVGDDRHASTRARPRRRHWPRTGAARCRSRNIPGHRDATRRAPAGGSAQSQRWSDRAAPGPPRTTLLPLDAPRTSACGKCLVRTSILDLERIEHMNVLATQRLCRSRMTRSTLARSYLSSGRGDRLTAPGGSERSGWTCPCERSRSERIGERVTPAVARVQRHRDRSRRAALVRRDPGPSRDPPRAGGSSPPVQRARRPLAGSLDEAHQQVWPGYRTAIERIRDDLSEPERAGWFELTFDGSPGRVGPRVRRS